MIEFDALSQSGSTHSIKFDKFTPQSRGALTLAAEEADRLGSAMLDTPHLLLGLMGTRDGLAARVLAELSDPAGLRQSIELLALERQPTVGVARRLKLAAMALSGSEWKGPARGGLAPQTKEAIRLAVDEARRHGLGYLGTEHLLIGLLRQESDPTATLLVARGLTWQEARARTRSTPEAGPTAGSETTAAT